MFFSCVLLCLLVLPSRSGDIMENYMQQRNNLLQRRRKLATGGKVTLSEKERIVNQFLMDLKLEELYHYKSNNAGQHFPPANHFLKAKGDIEKSDVFKIIKKMPKGRFINFSYFCSIKYSLLMMTSSNGNILRVTGHLCGEFTGDRWIPRTKASDAELWCFLRSAPK